jgi:hypothetical protein
MLRPRSSDLRRYVDRIEIRTMNQLEPYRPQHGPVETLLTLDRNRGTERLRASLETFNGFRFVRLQVWQMGGQGEWWPVRGKCVTIKLRECSDLAQILADVAREHQDQQPPGTVRTADPRPGSRGSSTWGGRRPPQPALPGPTGASGDPPFEPTRGGAFNELD